METIMASIIDEFRTYLNTPKKIMIFRFGISFVFFLLGLTMVTRVCFTLEKKKTLIFINQLGWFICIKYNRSIFRWISLVSYWCC